MLSFCKPPLKIVLVYFPLSVHSLIHLTNVWLSMKCQDLFVGSSVLKKIWCLPTHELMLSKGNKKRSSVYAFWNTGSEGFVWHHGVWEKGPPHQTGGRGDGKHGGCDSWSDFVRWMKVWPRRVGNERSHNKLLALSAITVLSGCNKTPQTGWLINRRNLFLTVLEVEKSKIRAPAIQYMMRAHFLVCRQLSFCSVLTGQQRVTGSLRGLFHKGTYRIQEVSTLRT